ncbi:hypothetical protein JRG19_03275 [Pseudoclavibacter alba]|uniref:Uncharacterized protein n=1 Tax=Pseudoclavibacter albus TaxID=272241 RepID=A0ABT2HYE4_9MICO|nr:hypothetical protein [Pseudoclavibacter alba]MBN6777572.1 hypothetical protein [Pseudoclavibacter alba]MCT2043338.1 hypothetical protein [Pseudoclavibacter alba]
MNHAPTRIIHRPDDADGRRVWRLDPNALEPNFPYARTPGGRRYGSLIGAGIVALVVVATIFRVAHEVFSPSIVGGGRHLSVIVAILISVPTVVFIGLLGWAGTRRWRWIDRATGRETQRVSIRRPGDVDQAVRMQRIIMGQAAGDPRAPALAAMPPLVQGERPPRRGAEVCISVYVPDARALQPVCLVTTAVAVPELVKQGNMIVLPRFTVNRMWADHILATTAASVAAGASSSSSDGSDGGWHCDDGSASGCGDSGGGDSGGDFSGDSGGGDGGGGD